jgi:hypothetical protein
MQWHRISRGEAACAAHPQNNPAPCKECGGRGWIAAAEIDDSDGTLIDFLQIVSCFDQRILHESL